MDAPVEQLYYTWAPRGIEGRNRFQFAAASSGLRSGALVRLLSTIRKFCRYDPPNGGRKAESVTGGPTSTATGSSFIE